MSRRNAANFSLGGSHSQLYHYTAPKSRSENFVDFMKGTGFKLPKYYKPSQCEFVFQNTELFDCAKFLMGRAKYFVKEEDMSRYNSFVSNEVALSRIEVQEALVQSNQTDLKLEKQTETLEEKRFKLGSEIQEIKARIQQWQHTKSMHSHVLQIKKVENSHQDYQEKNWKRKLNYLEQELQQLRVNAREEILSSRSLLVEAIDLWKRKEKFYHQEPALLCQCDWSHSMDEESLMTLLRTTSENYGTGLLGKSNDFDPFMEEKTARECAEHVKDIERLQYLILFETLQKVILSAKLEKYAFLESKMNELMGNAKRIVSQDFKFQSKISDEIHQRFEESKTRGKSTKKRKLKEVCGSKMGDLVDQIRNVQNVRSLAKIKEANFFGIVSQMLLKQRARHEVGLALMKQEVTFNSKIMDLIRKFGHQLRYIQEIEQFMNPEDTNRRLALVNPNLISTFNRNGVPLSVLNSYEATWRFLALVDRNTKIDSMRKTSRLENQVASKIDRLKESTLAASETWDTFKSSYLNDSSREESLINILSHSNKTIKGKLMTYPETRERRIKESVELKRLKCEDINSFLKQIQSIPVLELPNPQ